MKKIIITFLLIFIAKKSFTQCNTYCSFIYYSGGINASISNYTLPPYCYSYVTNYEINWGDGNITILPNIQSQNHEYCNNGIYTIIAKVWVLGVLECSDTATVTVTAYVNSSTLYHSNTTNTVFFDATLNYSILLPQTNNFIWDFGDGTMLTHNNGGNLPYNKDTLSHTYLLQGVYYPSVKMLYSDMVGVCNHIVEVVDTIYINCNIIDTVIFQSNDTLFSNCNNGSYQWYDCSNQQTIIGATNQYFNFLTNGSYAVIINQNGCVDTSDCITISNVFVNNIEQRSNIIEIYPNPTNSKFQILNSKFQSSKELYNSVGQLLFTTKENEIDVSRLPKGVYFLKCEGQTKKVIVE